jgi:hypothetical protein
MQVEFVLKIFNFIAIEHAQNNFSIFASETFHALKQTREE